MEDRAAITRFKDGQFQPWDAPDWWDGTFGFPGGYDEVAGPEGCRQIIAWGDVVDGAVAYSAPRGFVVALTTSDHVMHVWCSNEADFLTLVTGPLKAWLQLAGHRP